MDRLPPYVFAKVNQIKMYARRKGDDIIDLGMGNPDLGTPQHIVDKLVEASQKPHNHRYSASLGSVEFSKFLIKEAQVAVSPGLGFDEYGDDYVRFALIENNMRINQAVRGIRKIM